MPAFWTSTSNKRLNFVQHMHKLVKQHGKAAVLVPDNVLFEGRARETVRRKLLQESAPHLPTAEFVEELEAVLEQSRLIRKELGEGSG